MNASSNIKQQLHKVVAPTRCLAQTREKQAPLAFPQVAHNYESTGSTAAFFFLKLKLLQNTTLLSQSVGVEALTRGVFPLTSEGRL